MAQELQERRVHRIPPTRQLKADRPGRSTQRVTFSIASKGPRFSHPPPTSSTLVLLQALSTHKLLPTPYQASKDIMPSISRTVAILLLSATLASASLAPTTPARHLQLVARGANDDSDGCPIGYASCSETTCYPLDGSTCCSGASFFSHTTLPLLHLCLREVVGMR